MSDSPEELELLVDDLSETLEALDRRLDTEPRQRRALLRFTEQYAIPTTVAMLEANIRVLEAIGGAIRMAEGREPRERTQRGRETALATLDRALSEVSDAVAGTPTDPEARELLSEARTLRDEIRTRVDATGAGDASDTRSVESASGTTIPVAAHRTTEAEGDGSPAADDDPSPEEGIDVDAELDTIREEVHGDRAESGDDGDERGTDEPTE